MPGPFERETQGPRRNDQPEAEDEIDGVLPMIRQPFANIHEPLHTCFGAARAVPNETANAGCSFSVPYRGEEGSVPTTLGAQEQISLGKKVGSDTASSR